MEQLINLPADNDDDCDAEEIFANSFYVLTSLGLDNANFFDGALEQVMALSGKHPEVGVTSGAIRAAHKRPELLQFLLDLDHSPESSGGDTQKPQKFPKNFLDGLEAIANDPEFKIEHLEGIILTAKNFPNLQITPELVKSCHENPDAFRILENFAKDHSDLTTKMSARIQSALVKLCFENSEAFHTLEKFIKDHSGLMTKMSAPAQFALINLCCENPGAFHTLEKFIKDHSGLMTKMSIPAQSALVNLCRDNLEAFERLSKFFDKCPNVHPTVQLVNLSSNENVFGKMQEFVESVGNDLDASKLLELMIFSVNKPHLSVDIWGFAKDFPERKVVPEMVELYSIYRGAFKKAYEFVGAHPNVQMSPSLMKLSDNTDAFERFGKFAKEFPKAQMTSSLVELLKNEVKFGVARQLTKKFKKINVLMTEELVDLSLDHKYGDAFVAVHQFAEGCPNVRMSAELVKLCKENPDAFKNLQQFAKVNSNVKITPAVVTLFAKEPDITKKIASMGTVDYAYECFAEQRGEETNMILSYETPAHKHDVVRPAVDALFADGEVNDARIAEFMRYGDALGYFFKDGLRCEIPAMVLPNDVRVVSKKDRGSFYEAIGKKDSGGEYQFQKDYLEYLVGQFKKAYGKNAKNAFYVYMQNFTGSGNSMSCIALLANRCNVPDLDSIGVGSLTQCADRRITVTMDENFNATYDVVFDMSWRKEHADYIKQCRSNGTYPQWYDENAVMVTTVRAYIPAAHNSDASDPYDQRGQNGRQETHTSVIVSRPPKPAHSPGEPQLPEAQNPPRAPQSPRKS
jgi:hypothetical protein